MGARRNRPVWESRRGHIQCSSPMPRQACLASSRIPAEGARGPGTRADGRPSLRSALTHTHEACWAPLAPIVEYTSLLQPTNRLPCWTSRPRCYLNGGADVQPCPQFGAEVDIRPHVGYAPPKNAAVRLVPLCRRRVSALKVGLAGD